MECGCQALVGVVILVHAISFPYSVTHWPGKLQELCYLIAAIHDSPIDSAIFITVAP